MSTYSYERSARRPRAIAFVALWWIVLILLYVQLDAAPVIVLILACVSLPALYDIGAGAHSELHITPKVVEWRSGRRKAHLPRAQLKSVRLDTRLDLSLRMTLLTHQGGKVRLPYECVPNAKEIERALKENDIQYERHHFTLMS